MLIDKSIESIVKGEGTFPLYIGKSVDIRSRAISHFWTPDEASMIAQTSRIDYIETEGEIGALLLESRMFKEHNPLFNQRLRRVRTLCSIRFVRWKFHLLKMRKIATQ